MSGTTSSTPKASTLRNRRRRAEKKARKNHGQLVEQTHRMVRVVGKMTKKERRAVLVKAGLQAPDKPTRDGRLGNVIRGLRVLWARFTEAK